MRRYTRCAVAIAGVGFEPHDLLVMSQAGTTKLPHPAREEGIEPSASRLRSACSACLSYGGKSGHLRDHRLFGDRYSVFKDQISAARGRTSPSRRQTLRGEGGIRTPNVRTHADFTGRLPDRFGVLSGRSWCSVCPRNGSCFSAFQMPLKRKRPGHLSGPAFLILPPSSQDLRTRSSCDILIIETAGGPRFGRRKTHECGQWTTAFRLPPSRNSYVMQRGHRNRR